MKYETMPVHDCNAAIPEPRAEYCVVLCKIDSVLQPLPGQ